MFTSETYCTLNIMVFLSHNYGKEAISIDSISDYCHAGPQTVKKQLRKMEDLKLVTHTSKAPGSFSLAKAPHDIRLCEIIMPLEPSIFSEKEHINNLTSGQSLLFYHKFRPIQDVIYTKLRRCRLSDWMTMTARSLYTM